MCFDVVTWFGGVENVLKVIRSRIGESNRILDPPVTKGLPQ